MSQPYEMHILPPVLQDLVDRELEPDESGGIVSFDFSRIRFSIRDHRPLFSDLFLADRRQSGTAFTGWHRNQSEIPQHEFDEYEGQQMPWDEGRF